MREPPQHYAKWKEAGSEGCLLRDSTPMPPWGVRNCKKQKQFSGCRSLGVGAGDWPQQGMCELFAIVKIFYIWIG